MSFDLLSATPQGPGPNGYRVVFPYPAGRVASDYLPSGAYLTVGGESFSQDDDVFSVMHGSAGAEVVYRTAPTIAAGVTWILTCPLTPSADLKHGVTATAPGGSRAPLIAFDGDSIEENGVLQSGANSTIVSWRAMCGALPGVTGQRVQTHAGLNFATSGHTSASILAGVGRVLESPADIVWCRTSPNDFLVGATVAHLAAAKANWTAYWDRVLAAGKEMWTSPPLPREQTDTGARELLIEFSRWVVDQEKTRRNFKVFDVGHLFVNPTDTNYSPRTNYCIDSSPALHPQNLGMLSSITPIRDYVVSRFQAQPPAMKSVADAYSATNLTGNLLTNGILDGTSGGSTGTSSTITGSGTAIATGWNVTTVAQSGGVMTSLVTTATKNTTADGYPEQVIALTGDVTGNTSTGSLVRLMQTLSAPQFANMSIGDIVQGEGEVEMDTATAQCLAGFSLTLRLTINGTQQTVVDGFCNANDILPSFAQSFRFRTSLYRRDGVTPAINMTHVPSAGDFGIWGYFKGGAQTSISTTFRIRRMSLRKVIL